MAIDTTKNTIVKVQELKLTSKTVVYIDYGNVYGWKSHLKKPVDPKVLYKYLKKYSKIDSLNFFYGTDVNQKSIDFLNQVKKIGYNLITKPVKYITVGKVNNQDITIRKCDFDIEVCMNVYQHLNEGYDTFIFFSGDGDFAPVYEYLIKQAKKVIVIYEQGHLGKEIWDIKKGLFKTRYSFLQVEKQK
ncbi:NYN domain-containing protein [Candidatus Shapirobacteria bacterium]|nr:NYN domain-containing protein [Candidatus Shapirobacteria bacterium]